MTASTTWPPVTFEYLALLSNVGKNRGVLLTSEAGYVPFNTWYVKSAWIAAVSFCVMIGLLKMAEKASFDGASIVIFFAVDRVDKS